MTLASPKALSRLARELRKRGATTVVITHNVAIGQIADRVIHFSDGRVARIEENATKISALDLAW